MKQRGRLVDLCIMLAVGALTGVVFATVVQHHAKRGGISAVLQIGSDTFDRNPQMRGRTGVRDSLALTTGGYDAQYYYFAVFDPLVSRYAHAPDNYSHMMDAAPYRFGRIGHAWLTRAIAGGRWQRYPETMVWSVVGGAVLSAMLLAWLALQHGQSPWWGLVVLAVPGFWQSIQAALPEPLAAAYLLAGLLCMRTRYWATAVLPFALAALTRETSLVFVGAMAGASFVAGDRLKGVVIVAGAAIPLALWKWHVASVLFPVWGWQGLWYSPGTFGVPFGWVADLWRHWQAGTYFPHAPEVARAAWAFTALVTAVSGIAFYAAWRRPSGITIAAALYAVIALVLNYQQVWAHVGNAQRTSGELFFCLFLAAATAHLPMPRVRALALGAVVASAVYSVGFAHDAAVIRAALFWR